MLRNVLLCSDGSLYSVVATEYALWFCKRFGAHLRVVHVSDVRQREYEAMLPQLKKYQEDKSRIILESAATLARDRDVTCSVVRKSGRVSQAILEEEEKADLVVLGQRGENAEQMGDLMGSSVERLVRQSVKPCLVTPGKFKEINRLLVAYDGSEFARKSLRQGVDLAAKLGLEVCIITVAGDDRLAADAVLDDGVRLAKKRALEPRAELLKGHPETEILRFAEQQAMGLIVMGAYGHTRLREFILGSITSHVIRKSRAPVLLTR